MYANQSVNTQLGASAAGAAPTTEHRYQAGVNYLSSQAVELNGKISRLEQLLAPVVADTAKAVGEESPAPYGETALLSALIHPAKEFDKALARLEDLLQSIRI